MTIAAEPEPEAAAPAPETAAPAPVPEDDEQLPDLVEEECEYGEDDEDDDDDDENDDGGGGILGMLADLPQLLVNDAGLPLADVLTDVAASVAGVHEELAKLNRIMAHLVKKKLKSSSASA